MKLKGILKDKKGVFGLTAIQQFFAIILGLALLAYIIVIILGVLGGTTILAKTSATTYNETGWLNDTKGTYTLSTAITGLGGFANPSIRYVKEVALVIPVANYTFNTATYGFTNATLTAYQSVNITYSYDLYTAYQNRLDTILQNTSSGVTGFFGAISPIYAILAILIIILILVVLVRVVQAPGARSEEVGL
jgi:hypothetical protein